MNPSCQWSSCSQVASDSPRLLATWKYALSQPSWQQPIRANETKRAASMQVLPHHVDASLPELGRKYEAKLRWAKKSCHINKLFLSSSVLLSREWSLMFHLFVDFCGLIIIRNTERHWSWRQYLPKQTLPGRRSGGKCHQGAEEGVSNAQSKMASRNKQLGETALQAAWKDVYIEIFNRTP